jgi:hypothetical protein
MESLALLVFALFCAVLLGSPLAYLLAVLKRNWLAAFLAGLSIGLGMYWFAVVVTPAKYLGVVSGCIGLLALLKVASNYYDDK